MTCVYYYYSFEIKQTENELQGITTAVYNIPEKSIICLQMPDNKHPSHISKHQALCSLSTVNHIQSYNAVLTFIYSGHQEHAKTCSVRVEQRSSVSLKCINI
jgi:hypothetical protein